jgi:hypothetical protein
MPCNIKLNLIILLSVIKINSMNQEDKKAVKKVWNTPNFVDISVEETLGGFPGIVETGYYAS